MTDPNEDKTGKPEWPAGQPAGEGPRSEQAAEPPGGPADAGAAAASSQATPAAEQHSASEAASETESQAAPSGASQADEDQDDEGKDGADNNGDESKPPTAGNRPAKVFALVIVLITVIALCYSYKSYQRLERLQCQGVRASWSMPPGASLGPGPAAFRYDADEQELSYRGVIDDETQRTLLGLLRSGGQGEQTGAALTKEQEAAYQRAVQQMADDSRCSLAANLLLFLLVLSGLGGVVGVQIRSLNDFVNHACRLNDLDLAQWWPWYLIRPVLGFVLAALCVVLIKAGFFSLQNVSPSSNLAWFGLAVLVGFGTQDFLERLRLVTGTLFGVEKQRPSAAKGEGAKSAQPPAGEAKPSGPETGEQRKGQRPGEPGAAQGGQSADKGEEKGGKTSADESSSMKSEP